MKRRLAAAASAASASVAACAAARVAARGGARVAACATARVAAFVAILASGSARAHGVEERYDLPVPVSYVIGAACVVVALTFVATAFFARSGDRLVGARHEGSDAGGESVDGGQPPAQPGIFVPPALLAATRSLTWLLFMVAIVAALYGTQDPLMNLAPTLVWVVWWVGFSVLSAIVGNLWAAFDPWRTTFDVLHAAVRGRGAGSSAHPMHRPWPAALGLWPATALLLGWSWLEIVYPLASTPAAVGAAALAWTAASLGGMVLFGPAAWQRHGDAFAIVFSTLGRMAPVRLRIGDRPEARAPAGQVGFVIAMLSTVIFDGFHGGAAWNGFDAAVRDLAPHWHDVNGYVVGSVGLVAVWLGLLLAFRAALAISFGLGGAAPVGAERAELASRLALALVPIALGYLVAHNFSSLIQQGPVVLQLLSDPFGRQWDLFGTVHRHFDTGLVSARSTWWVAVSAIVLGHVLSIVRSHRVVAEAGWSARRAATAMLPMAILMVLYTAVSLILIAEPMVTPRG
jgi:hypothetical protein